MKNNYGFGRFEVLTVIVLLLAIFAYLAYSVLGGTSPRKIDAMKDSAISFSKAVTVNNSSFHNTENVYLQEVIDEKLIKEIKSPVSMGNCSSSESVVQLIGGMPYVTLKCGKILIEKANFDSKEVPTYEVSDWSLRKPGTSSVEEKTLYNCKENGKELFPNYYDELYFIYEINKKYGTDYYYASNIENECELVSETFYRTKKKLDS